MTSVSAIITTYNRRTYVCKAVRSVLGQTLPVSEIVIVDDGSTDGTAESLRAEFGDRIRIIEKSNGGVSSARAAGTAAAEGDWIAFLDSDDEWTPERNSHLVRAVERLPADVPWLFGDTMIVTDAGEMGRVFTLYKLDVGRPFTVFDDPMPTQHPFQFSLMQSSMIRTEVLRRVGAFSEDLRSSEDVLVGWQIAANHRMAAIPEVVTRVHRLTALAASSADRAGQASVDYHRARMLGYAVLARSKRPGPWAVMHSASVRRLCLRMAKERTPGVRVLATQQFQFIVSAAAICFMVFVVFGPAGVNAWNRLAQAVGRFRKQALPIGIPVAALENA